MIVWSQMSKSCNYCCLQTIDTLNTKSDGSFVHKLVLLDLGEN